MLMQSTPNTSTLSKIPTLGNIGSWALVETNICCYQAVFQGGTLSSNLRNSNWKTLAELLTLENIESYPDPYLFQPISICDSKSQGQNSTHPQPTPYHHPGPPRFSFNGCFYLCHDTLRTVQHRHGGLFGVLQCTFGALQKANCNWSGWVKHVTSISVGQLKMKRSKKKEYEKKLGW